MHDGGHGNQSRTFICCSLLAARIQRFDFDVSYIYIYIYIYICMHLCIYASMHLCIYASMHLCIYASMHLCLYASMHLCIYASMHLCIYASMHRCINLGTGVRCLCADSSTVFVCVVGRCFLCVLSVDIYLLVYCLTFSVFSV